MGKQPRRRATRPLKSLFVIVMATTLLAVGTAAYAAFSNGDFETCGLQPWFRANGGSNGADGWYAYAGTSSPVQSLAIAAPPQGGCAAVTDQNGPGAHVLYQKLRVRAGRFHLSMSVYYENRALGGVFCSPNDLRLANTTQCNQQYRIDVIRAGASPFSTRSGDVLKRLFATQPGDPASLAPTTKVFNLRAFRAQTVVLRFVEVDNQSVFNASVDDVKLV